MSKVTIAKNIKSKLYTKFMCSSVVFSMLITKVYASGDSVGGIVDKINTGGDGNVYGIIGELINILSWIAFAIAVFKVIQIGIMFMLGAGSSRSNAKTAIIPWLVGAAVCVLFGTVGPWIIDLIMGGSSGGNVFEI